MVANFNRVWAGAKNNRLAKTVWKLVHPFGCNFVYWQSERHTDRHTEIWQRSRIIHFLCLRCYEYELKINLRMMQTTICTFWDQYLALSKDKIQSLINNVNVSFNCPKQVYWNSLAKSFWSIHWPKCIQFWVFRYFRI